MNRLKNQRNWCVVSTTERLVFTTFQVLFSVVLLLQRILYKLFSNFQFLYPFCASKSSSILIVSSSKYQGIQHKIPSPFSYAVFHVLLHFGDTSVCHQKLRNVSHIGFITYQPCCYMISLYTVIF